ncbi:MAG: hypothetical protein QOI73_3593 [Solirubrobacteraceae bacterium]|nr:hypothetical protein [Solirubrobacteraceae bacterium]
MTRRPAAYRMMVAAMDYITFLSAVVLLAGWIATFCLWWFVFRKGGDDDR